MLEGRVLVLMYKCFWQLIVALLSSFASKPNTVFIKFSLCCPIGPVYIDPMDWKKAPHASLIIVEKVFPLVVAQSHRDGNGFPLDLHGEMVKHICMPALELAFWKNVPGNPSPEIFSGKSKSWREGESLRELECERSREWAWEGWGGKKGSSIWSVASGGCWGFWWLIVFCSVVISLFDLENTQETLASLLHCAFFELEFVSLHVLLFVLSILFFFFFNAF